MTQRTRGRHHAPSRWSSSLSTTARMSAAVAVSGGLVAAMSVPANAAAEGSGTLLATPSDLIKPVAEPVTISADGAAQSPAAMQIAPAQMPAGLVATDYVRPAPESEEDAEPREATTGGPDRTARSASARQAQNDSPRQDSQPADDRGEQAPAAQSGTGGKVIAIAKKYTGTPYVYGGSTPSGFDCSGFTSYVFRQVGIELPRTSRAQQAHATRVSDPRPGDLVFRNFPATHVGIYVGNGQMIDSSQPGTSITIRPVGPNISYGRVL